MYQDYKAIVSLSLYVNLFSITGLLLILPLHHFTRSLRERYKLWSHTSYLLKKLTYVSVLCLISMYTLTPSLWIVSLFIDSMSSTYIFVSFILMLLIGFVMWSVSLLVYSTLVMTLALFGITLFSLSQLKNQISKY
jgi:hypothetical protein